MKRAKWLLAGAAAGLVVGALVYAQTAAGPGSPDTKADVGQPAPDFKLKDTFGKEFTPAEFKGKTVVLEWINQGCPVSRGCHDKKTMQDLYKKYASKGVVWLAIDTGVVNTPESNRVYAAETGLAYPVLHDADGKVGKLYGAQTTPHMYVIDKSGTLVYTGAIDDNQGGKTNYVADALEAVLAGKPVAKAKTKPYGCSVKYPAPKAAAK